MKEKNFAFIDGQNLFLQIKKLGWKIDLKKFRIYLKEKYKVKKAYYFIGYVEENEKIYSYLKKIGYTVIFKETFKTKGIIKGNVDAELVLYSMIEYSNYDKAIIVTGDGDFACLIKYLREQDKLKIVLVPDKRSYSFLINKAAGKLINFLNFLKNKIE